MNMDKRIEIFKEEKPSIEQYWRSINLFGRNTASYKFALAESLLELAKFDKTHITLDEIAVPYTKAICEHLKTAPRQYTGRSNTFIDTCKNYNLGIITKDQLISEAVYSGFNYVLDAFHKVNGSDVEKLFYEYDRKKKEINLTDNMFNLLKTRNSSNLYLESEARWKLVEHAWEIGVNKHLLEIKYDENNNILFTEKNSYRKDVTSAKSALNGYQKGKCFYCFDDIIVSNDSSNTCDVDHFIPITLQRYLEDVNLNGVWNLVLSCIPCNRGEEGKFDRIPVIKYLERLHKRNEFLISSHHPLRETIMNQTGLTELERRKFLNNIYKRALSIMPTTWEIKNRGPILF